MADVNALYPHPPKQTESLLSGDITKLIGTANALQQMGARQAIGGAYQKAINPTTGEIDTPTLMREIGSNPQAAYMAGEAAQGALARQGQAIQNSTAQFDQQAKQTQFMISGLGALADLKNPTHQDVTDFIVRAARMTNIPSGVLSGLGREAPRDPEKLRSWLLNLRKQAIGSAGLTEEAPIGVTPRGETIKGTKGQFLEQSVTPRGGGIVTSLGPAQTAAATATGAGAGQNLTAAREQSLSFPNHVFPLEQAIEALERLGPQGTGPGSDTLNQIKSFALTMGVPGIDSKEVATYDKAKKYLTDYVNQTGNSSTNDKLAAAFAGNPSTTISNAGAVEVAKAALALRRNQEARTRAFEDSGLPESEFSKFAGKWNREHDVRVYGWDLMTPAQRKQVLKDMPQTKRDLFALDVEDAEKSGVIRPPRILPPSETKKK